MRIAINSFRGEAPRVTPRALPDNAAQDATNSRLLTGDLEAWRQFALEHDLANSTSPVETIYKLKDVWLSWSADVNAARGAVAGDTTYRTFLTGPDVYERPQFTNYEMATSGAEPYPSTTRPLGVPGPNAAPTVVAGIDPNPTTFNVDILDSGDQFATNWTGAPSQFAHGGATIVQQSAVVGHPAPSYETLFDDNPGAPSYLYRNFGVEKCTVVRESFDFYMTSGSGNDFQMNAGIMRTLAGAGVVVGLAQSSPGQGVLSIGSAQGWTIIGQSSLVASSPVPISFSTWYTCEVQMLTNSDGTQTVTATLSLGSVQLAAVTATGTFLNGDYCGFYSETNNNDGVDRYRTYYDNILVQGSGATGYIAANVATNYVYTYVNDLGQESAPSFASATVLRPDGIAITVTTATVLPSGFDDYGIATKRIYRAVSGATGTSYQFVAEIPLAQADYVDSIPDTELGEVLQSELWALPPDDLHGLVALPNGVLAGFSKNQLCLSAQNYPHAWPVEYRLNVDTDIVAIGVIDTTVVIGTQNFIYLAIGTDPAAYSMTKLEVPQACVAKRSLAYLTGIGVVFASPDGLIAVAGNGNVRNLTSGIFTRKQWQALKPETITAVAHDDVYHFFYRLTPIPAAVGLLMHCDNLDDGTVFLDSSGSSKVIVSVPDASQQAPSIKFGPACGVSSGGRVTIGPYSDLGFTGDFGIDMWSQNSNGTAFTKRTFFSNRLAGGAGMGFEFCQDSNLLHYRSSDGTTVVGTTVIPDNVTAHIAFERMDGVIHAYVNGVPEFTVVDARDFSANTTLCFFDNFGTGNTFNGKLDEIRVVTDSAPYGGAGFTPPTQPYPDPGSVVLPPEFGYALDMKPDGFGLIELSYHASACFADPLTDYLYLVLDSLTEPTDVYLPLPSTAPTDVDGLSIYTFDSPDGDGQMVYRWLGKLNLLAHPAVFKYGQVRADDYDNLVLRLYADGVLLMEEVISDETPFTLPQDNDYTTFEIEFLGTSRVRTVQVAEDIEEFD